MFWVNWFDKDKILFQEMDWKRTKEGSFRLSYVLFDFLIMVARMEGACQLQGNKKH